MTTKEDKNRFADEALQYIAEINTRLSDYKSAEERSTESKKQLEKAKSEVDAILSETYAEPLDCAERPSTIAHFPFL